MSILVIMIGTIFIIGSFHAVEGCVFSTGCFIGVRVGIMRFMNVAVIRELAIHPGSKAAVNATIEPNIDWVTRNNLRRFQLLNTVVLRAAYHILKCNTKKLSSRHRRAFPK